MGKRYLIDSNVVVDFLGGKLPEDGKQLMLQLKPEISIITSIEILSKKDIPLEELQKYKSFINSSHVYSDITQEIADQAVNVRKKYSLKTPDAIIAATAIVNKLILITRNEKDFDPIYNFDLINPWKLNYYALEVHRFIMPE